MKDNLKQIIFRKINVPRPSVGPILRWALSFVVIDLMVLALLFVGYVKDFELCGVGGVFLIAGFYYPYSFLVPDLGVMGGLGVGVFLAPLFAAVAIHALAGAVVGYIRRNRKDMWRVTVPVAVAIGLVWLRCCCLKL